MILELKRGFQSLTFKIQNMNHSLGDLVTGLEGRSHVPGAGLSSGIGSSGSGEVRLPGAKTGLDRPRTLPGFSSPRSTAEICRSKYLCYVCTPDTPTSAHSILPLGLSSSPKKGTRSSSHLCPFLNLLGSQRRLKIKTKSQNP